ncbi:MAG: hypothetical protein U0905_05410 [Pirellulales bacterium]
MNFFTHARRYLHDPYLVAGTAIPDWLSVLDRRVRARSQSAATLIQDSDPRVVSLAKGIIQHHYDDGWFHQTEAFYQISGSISRQLRTVLGPDESMRPSFVGHISLELLLDDELIQSAPDQLDQYYAILQSLDPGLIEHTITRISKHPADRLAALIPRFIAERFLYDYATNDRLVWRINHVLKRVGLERVPTDSLDWLEHGRQAVRERLSDLLAGEEDDLAAHRIQGNANAD